MYGSVGCSHGAARHEFGQTCDHVLGLSFRIAILQDVSDQALGFDGGTIPARPCQLAYPFAERGVG